MNIGRMNATLRHGTVALALIGGIGIAAAQSPSSTPPGGTMGGNMSQSTSTQQKLQLSAAQKTAIFKAVSQDKTKLGPTAANFHPSIGAKVPSSIALYALPDNAVAGAPAAKSLKYTMAQNQVVLVNPTTLEIVDIIRQ